MFGIDLTKQANTIPPQENGRKRKVGFKHAR